MESQPQQTPPRATEQAVAAYRAVTAELWRRGNLAYKLHRDQLSVLSTMVAAFAAGAGRFVFECARRWGKTWLLCILAIETCVKKPGARVVYGAPTLKDLAEFIIPTIEKITADAPPGLRWRFVEKRLHFVCENGSYIHLFGCDDKRKANRGRGPGAELVILDECGFIAILGYVLRSVVRPQLFHSGGKVLLASTPAEEPDHDFTAIAELAEAQGNYARRTVYDNPLKTRAEIQAYIETDARDEGMTPEEYKLTDTFRREYLAERVINKLLVVVPEWESARAELFVPLPRPDFFHGTTILDPGGADPHAVSFAYWDFLRAQWVVEDELLLRDGENTGILVERVKAKERELWGVDKWEGTLRGVKDNPEPALLKNLPDFMEAMLVRDAPEQPFARWTDTDLHLCRDLYELHGLAFIPTAKDDKELQVNNLRELIRTRKLVVHPRCVHTDRHLRSTVWKDHKRREYARRGGEHGDLVDTLVYGARNLDRRNPYPPGWRKPDGTPVKPPPSPAEELKKRQDEEALVRALTGNQPLGRRLLNRRR